MQTSRFGPPERVYVEIEYYDGPRAGVADIGGVPHRFLSPTKDWGLDELGVYYVWPIDDTTLALELERWSILVEWDIRYMAGLVSADTHPGNAGSNSRWEALDSALKESRCRIPEFARRARVQFTPREKKHRFESDGPSYDACWLIL